MLVIPAYAESASLLDKLTSLAATDGRTLVIVVLNYPDSDSDAQVNMPLRSALANLATQTDPALRRLNPHTDLYLHDLDSLRGPLPATEGVGLARKIGCDIAFKWICEGAIRGRWICSTDADATLSPGYFQALAGLPAATTAATYPFRHTAGADSACNTATALYELRLHHYVLGLEYAGSPYAFHSLGSCLAVTADAYAQVHGFPKRAGAEDFYLLNKLAKITPVARLQGECLQLESRASTRVPFGTGPAVAAIIDTQKPLDIALFYHPAGFGALRAVLATVAQLQAAELSELKNLLRDEGLEPPLLEACETVLLTMGLDRAIDHCRRQANDCAQFMRQFHQWFDGFRTLKFIHGIRDAGWPVCSLAELDLQQPALWPSAKTSAIEDRRQAILDHWSWSR